MKVDIDIVDSIEVFCSNFKVDISKNGKPNPKLYFLSSYHCFCGLKAPKEVMYPHLIDGHHLPRGVVELVLGISPQKKENSALSQSL